MIAEIIQFKEHFPNGYLAFFFVFGSIVGSFLNVCIFRIPENKSIIFPSSQCSCGAKIAWYDNIPILSWVLLKGRCRECHKKISLRYPIIEGLTGLLFLLSAKHLEGSMLFCGLALIGILICATFIDFDHMIIPDRFTIGGFVAGICLSFIFPEIHGYGQASKLPWFVEGIRSGIIAIIGGCIGSGVVLWIALLGEIVFKKEVMGFGDVKLLGCIGAFLGWKGAVFSIFGGAFLGSIILVPLLLLQNGLGREFLTTAKADPEKEEGTLVPFGPWLAVGAIAYLIYLRQPVNDYFVTLERIFLY